MTGTGELLKFNLKRASRRIAIWAAAIGVVYLYCVFALGAMFDTTEAQQQRAALATTPASILMAGPGYGVDNYTLGPMLAHELMLWFIIALGIMSALLAVQLTRADEETGRAELTRSAVVSRFAPLIAAALTVLIANIAIAAVSLIALLAGGLPLTDSLAYVSAVALGAMAFGAVALLAANLTEHSRGASGLAIGVLVAAVLLRGIGDMTGRSRTPRNTARRCPGSPRLAGCNRCAFTWICAGGPPFWHWRLAPRYWLRPPG